MRIAFPLQMAVSMQIKGAAMEFKGSNDRGAAAVLLSVACCYS